MEGAGGKDGSDAKTGASGECAVTWRMHAFANASNTLAVLQPASPTLAASLAHQTLSCVSTPVIDLLVSLVLSAPRLEELCVGLPPSTLEWTCDGALVQLLVDAWQRRASAAEGDAPVYVSWEEHEAGVLRLASSAETHPLRSGPTEHVEPVFARANEEKEHAEKVSAPLQTARAHHIVAISCCRPRSCVSQVGAHLPQPFFAVDMVRDEVDRPALGAACCIAPHYKPRCNPWHRLIPRGCTLQAKVFLWLSLRCLSAEAESGTLSSTTVALISSALQNVTAKVA